MVTWILPSTSVLRAAGKGRRRAECVTSPGLLKRQRMSPAAAMAGGIWGRHLAGGQVLQEVLLMCLSQEQTRGYDVCGARARISGGVEEAGDVSEHEGTGSCCRSSHPNGEETNCCRK